MEYKKTINNPKVAIHEPRKKTTKIEMILIIMWDINGRTENHNAEIGLLQNSEMTIEEITGTVNWKLPTWSLVPFQVKY